MEGYREKRIMDWFFVVIVDFSFFSLLSSLSLSLSVRPFKNGKFRIPSSLTLHFHRLVFI